MTDTKTPIESLPEDVQEYISRLRGENAKYRTERNEFEAKYTEAGSALEAANAKFTEYDEKVQGLVAENESLTVGKSDAEKKRARIEAAAKHGIYSHAHRLTGETPEELEADAKKFAADLGVQLPGDHAAGKTPPPPEDDPLKAGLLKALGKAQD